MCKIHFQALISQIDLLQQIAAALVNGGQYEKVPHCLHGYLLCGIAVCPVCRLGTCMRGLGHTSRPWRPTRRGRPSGGLWSWPGSPSPQRWWAWRRCGGTTCAHRSNTTLQSHTTWRLGEGWEEGMVLGGRRGWC